MGKLKLFRVEMTRVSYVLCESEHDAEEYFKHEENMDEWEIFASSVKKGDKPDGGWKENTLVYGGHSDDVTFAEAAKKYGQKGGKEKP